MQSHFETERLFLRPRTMSDFQACIEMDRDPEVTKYIPGPWNNPHEHEAFLKDKILHKFDDGLGYWSIFPKEQQEQFLGWILLIPEGGVGSEIEIGWRLNRLAWGNGYAPEAAQVVVSHAFNTLRLDCIVADIDPDNISSMRVAEKIGMKPDQKHTTDTSVCYGLTNTDFKSRLSLI